MIKFILLHSLYVFLPENIISFKMTCIVPVAARQLGSTTRTMIPIFNDKRFSRHLSEHLISLENNILFCSKN